MANQHVCHARCLASPPERVFSCKCPCGGEHHGTLFLAKLPWAERQREKIRVRKLMNHQLEFLDRKTEHASFIKESQKTAEMIASILSYEPVSRSTRHLPKKRIASKRRRA